MPHFNTCASRHAPALWRLWCAMLVMCAICLLALSPAISSLLRVRLAHGERALLGHAHAVPWLMAQVSMHAPLVYAAPDDGSHTYWQVGMMAGPDASDASGMRASITTRLPQSVAAHTTNYYWIGSYLDDGSFVQAGYFVSWTDPTSAGWFYCAFTAAGSEGPCVYGPAGSAGAGGTTHTYTLETISPATSAATPADVGPGTITWVAQVDSKPVGQFGWSSAETGNNSPSVFAESSGFTPHSAASQLGPVDFPAPIAVRAAGQSTYVVAAHLRPVYSAGDVCPPYGAAADGQGGVLLGSGLACPPVSQWLW